MAINKYLFFFVPDTNLIVFHLSHCRYPGSYNKIIQTLVVWKVSLLFFALLTIRMTNGHLKEKLDLDRIKKINQKEA